MSVSRCPQLVSMIIFIALLAAACGSKPTPVPTHTVPPATETPTELPTSTPKPTATPRPTATPNLEATQRVEVAHSKVSSYVESGWLSSAGGQLYRLNDYDREMAQINYLDYGLSGYNGLVRDFAVWGQIRMESARPVRYPEYSGCGFSFRISPKNYDGYTVHVTNESVLVTFCNESIHRCGRIGKTRGTGTLNLPNPAEAELEAVVSGTQLYVKVDGEFIGEYTLFADKMLDPGYILYSIVSGTNADYGTRCEITNGGLWVAK